MRDGVLINSSTETITQMNIIYVLGIISTSLALWFIPNDNLFCDVWLILPDGILYLWSAIPYRMAAAENSHKRMLGSSTGFVKSLRLYWCGSGRCPISVDYSISPLEWILW